MNFHHKNKPKLWKLLNRTSTRHIQLLNSNTRPTQLPRHSRISAGPSSRKAPQSLETTSALKMSSLHIAASHYHQVAPLPTIQSPPPRPPRLFLPSRVTAFLQSHLSSVSSSPSSIGLHTACLTTPSGKLLAHASYAASHGQRSARTLQRQCAVAASLWSLQGGDGDDEGSSVLARGRSGRRRVRFGEAALATLPGASSNNAGSNGTGASSTSSSGNAATPVAITVHFDSSSVFLLRRLKCGMLFICIGEGLPGSSPQQQGVQQQNTGAISARPSTYSNQQETPQSQATSPAGSPSEVASVISVATTATSTLTGGAGAGSGVSTVAALALRRQAETLAQWLDEALSPLADPHEKIEWDLR